MGEQKTVDRGAEGKKKSLPFRKERPRSHEHQTVPSSASSACHPSRPSATRREGEEEKRRGRESRGQAEEREEERGGRGRCARGLSSKVQTELREGYKKIGRQACNRSLGLTQDTRYTTDQVLDSRTCRLMLKILKRNALTDLSGAISTGKEANVYCVSGPPTRKKKGRRRRSTEVERETKTGGEDERSEGTGLEGGSSDEASGREDSSRSRDEREEAAVEEEREREEEEEQEEEEEGVSGPWRLYAMKVYRTSILTFQDRRKYVEGDHRFERAYTR